MDKKKRMVTVRKAYGNPKIFRGKNFSKEKIEEKLLTRFSYRTARDFLLSKMNRSKIHFFRKNAILILNDSYSHVDEILSGTFTNVNQ